MNNKKLGVFIALCSVGLLVLVNIFRVDDHDSTQTTQNRASIDETTHQSSERTGQSQTSGKKQNTQQSTATANKVEQALEKVRFAEIAEQYEAAIAFPSYSRPIRNEDDLHKYLPNQSVATELALDLADANSTKVSVELDRFQYHSGQNILVDATVQLAEDVQHLANDLHVNVKIFPEQNGGFNDDNSVATARAEKVDGQQVYSAQFNADAIVDTSDELSVNSFQLVVEVTLDGELYRIASPFEVHAEVAELTRVGNSTVQEDHLIIPLQIDTQFPGYYRVSANLYDEASGEPLIHLSEKARISGVNDEFSLKAHIAALKHKGQFSGYVLKDFNITRMPAAPHYRTMKGFSRYPEYPVNAFPKTAFIDRPYYNEHTQKRLEFLQQLANSKK